MTKNEKNNSRVVYTRVLVDAVDPRQCLKDCPFFRLVKDGRKTVRMCVLDYDEPVALTPPRAPLVVPERAARRSDECLRRAVRMNDMEAAIRERNDQITVLEDALRKVLPLAEAWHQRNFNFICDHEIGECTCDYEAKTREDIRTARATLGED
jgi:hypothetical protein